MINNYQNTGLNGRCGWICRKLNGIYGYVSGIPFVGSGVQNFITEIQKAVDLFDGNDGGYLFRSSGSDEATPQEEIVLNPFSEKLKFFVADILKALDKNFSTANANVQLYKMAVAKEYFLYNETAGLSQNAISLRLGLINQAFDPIQKIITEKLGAISGLPVKITANQADFNALFQDSVQGQVYAVRQYPNNAATGGSNIAINPISTIKPPTKNATIFDPVIKDSLVNTVSPVVTTNPAITVKPIVDQPTNTTVPVKDAIDKTFKYVGYGLLAITAAGVIKSFFKKK